MKTVYTFLASITLLTYCSLPKNKDIITVHGKIEGLIAKKVFLTDAYSSRHLDSCYVEDGKFKFEIKPKNDFEPHLVSIKYYTPEKTRIQFTFKNNIASSTGGTSAFMLEPGETFIKGKITMIEYNSTNQMDITSGKETEAQFANERNSFGSLNASDTQNRGVIIQRYKQIVDRYPWSHFLLDKLYQNRRSYTDSEIIELLSHFDKVMQNSHYFKEIKEYLANRNNDRIELTSFFLKSEKGDLVKLINSDARINMLIFWASWCGPCRLEVPHLKDIRNRYTRDQLQMTSISTDTDTSAWRKALVQEKMTWTQLITDSLNGRKIAYRFDFNSIPVVFFTNSKGKILSRINDYNEENKDKFLAVIDSLIQKVSMDNTQ